MLFTMVIQHVTKFITPIVFAFLVYQDLAIYNLVVFGSVIVWKIAFHLLQEQIQTGLFLLLKLLTLGYSGYIGF